MLKTRITELFGISRPIMSAPMTSHSGGRLAAAVSEAGGLGSFGAISDEGADWVREQIALTRSQTDRPFAVGFITPFIPLFEANFEAALDERAPVIAFSFSDPEPWLGRAKAAGAVTVCQVQTLAGAEQAVAAGADVLVAQGNEAGGHTGSMTLLPLLTRVVERYPDTPVMAAGGIGSGRALAAVLAAGADGAWAGTAFLATPEAVEVPDVYKERVVQSDGQDTVYTNVYDILDGVPWPDGIAARVFNNGLVREWHGRDDELAARRQELAPKIQEGFQRDPDVAAVYMGQSAGDVKVVRSAAEVLDSICSDAERILRERAAGLLDG